ncbi:MAG: hypothetical protein HRT68_10540 [Flavobacteriaceae bacterium]|nr:hypothetical protein [Flavobacteriaceae bacterium]
MTFTFNNCFTAMSTTTIAGITCTGPPIVFEENATNSEFDGSDPNAEFLVSYLEDTQASCDGPYPNSVIGFTRL